MIIIMKSHVTMTLNNVIISYNTKNNGYKNIVFTKGCLVWT